MTAHLVAARMAAFRVQCTSQKNDAHLVCLNLLAHLGVKK